MIRIAEQRDAAAVAAIYAPYVESTIVSFAAIAPSPDEMWTTISKNLERYPWLVMEKEGDVIGYAYAGVHRERTAYQWSVESSVYVADAHQRKGVARRLYEALFDILTRQGFFNVYAGITLPNDASIGFHESLGFEPIGVYKRIGHKFGQWHDTAWWALALKDHESDPPAPIWLPDLVA